jgi:hypothetical protein
LDLLNHYDLAKKAPLICVKEFCAPLAKLIALASERNGEGTMPNRADENFDKQQEAPSRPSLLIQLRREMIDLRRMLPGLGDLQDNPIQDPAA